MWDNAEHRPHRTVTVFNLQPRKIRNCLGSITYSQFDNILNHQRLTSENGAPTDDGGGLESWESLKGCFPYLPLCSGSDVGEGGVEVR
jgi:hypothetical protein